MKLIHTALKAEAKPLIEHFKLNCIGVKPLKLYKRDSLLLCVSGMGRENTLKIRELFKNYSIKKAINIGIAGCKDESIKIGSIFTCRKNLDSFSYASLTTVDAPLSDKKTLETTLVDMEAEFFELTSREFLQDEDIYILKIVSDYLDITIPKKEFVWKIIEKNLQNISQIPILKD